MSLLKDAMRGIEKFEGNFNKWAEKAYLILGNVTQCGIIEVDRSGHAFVVANRPDYCEQYLDKKGYCLDHRYTYHKHIPEGFFTLSTNEGINFLHNNEESLFSRKFNLWDGFSYSEKIDNNTHRYYVFASDSPEIYDKLINNFNLVKKFIKHFKQDNKHIINELKDNKFNLADNKENYFLNDKDLAFKPEHKKITSILHTLGVLENNLNITSREWQCLQLYCHGKSASQTGQILGISRRTVETYFVHLKQKLKINSKYELINMVK